MKTLGVSAFAVGLLLAGASDAATYNVSIWNGAPDGIQASTLADQAHLPTGAADAVFTWTGPINWVNNGPQNTSSSGNLFGSFLTGGSISGYSSPSGDFATVADLLNASMSIAGDQYVSYFQITGSYNATSVTGTLTHDDGASLYDYLGNAVVSSPNETSQVTDNFTLPGGAHNFTLDYVEANGSPSVLNFNVAAVPEPATWAMMLIGFFGIGAMVRSRRNARVLTA